MRQLSLARNPLFVWVSVATITLLATWIGWGWWGYGVASDYSLELADSIRLKYGQVPYHDFIPTYGAVTMFGLAPLLSLGVNALPAIWFATVALIIFECGLFLQLIKRYTPNSHILFASLLFVLAIVWIPSNSRYLLGYSTAGFISVILWTLIFIRLGKQPLADKWTALFLGLQLHTKLDMGVLSLVVITLIVVRNLMMKRFSHIGHLLLSFCAPSILIFGILLGSGAQGDLLFGSILEAFGQVDYVRDLTLGKRLLALLFLGTGLTIVQSLSFYRQVRPHVIRIIPVGFSILFCAAACVDTWRIVFLKSVQGPLAMNYFWVLAIVWVGSSWVTRLIAVRSLTNARRLINNSKVPLLLIAVVGISRCAIAGWYPLNYYQPAPLLLAFCLLFRATTWLPAVRKGALLFGITACGISAFASILPQDSLVWFQTPYGKVRLESGKKWSEPLPLYQRLQTEEKKSRLLCTYMPSGYLLTGLEPAGLYTYWHRLSAAGKYRPERERLAFQLIRQQPPKFILIEKERASFAKPFGSEFGIEIYAWLMEQYEEIDRFENSDKGSWKLFRLK